MRTILYGFGMIGMLGALIGCARAPEAWVDSPATRSPVTGLWIGTWKEMNHPGEGRTLRCTCLQTGTGQWKATFDAECGRPASFTFDLQGRQIGDRVVFEDTVDLGPENGGVYHWRGEVNGSEFTGTYKSEGYDGGFQMVKAEENAAASGAVCLVQ